MLNVVVLLVQVFWSSGWVLVQQC